MIRDKKEHKHINTLRQQLVDGRMERRDFLRYTTLLGLSASSAYAFTEKVTGIVRPAYAQTPQLRHGGTLRFGMSLGGDVTNAHAISWIQLANITTQVVDTLTRIDHDNVTRPHLAEDWEVSDDLRTWTIYLRKNAYWRKGNRRRFTADELTWNFKHILDPATGSAAVGLMKNYLLEEVESCDAQGNKTTVTQLWDRQALEKVDDYTVRFNLKIPYISLPEDLFFYCNTMLDPEEGGHFVEGANGTGAFELVERDLARGRAVLRARTDREQYFGFGPFLDELIFIDLGDEAQTLLSALSSRQVDAVYEMNTRMASLISLFPYLENSFAQTAATAILQMKVKQKPYDDPRVRLAMRYAMDPDVVLKLALNDLGLPAEHHFVCPIHPAYAKLPKMERDPEKARNLLTEAGYPNGIDIEMTCKADPPWELAAVQVIADQYSEAGIRMKINVMPQVQFWDNWDKVKLGFVEWAHRPLALTVLSLGFRTGVPWNAPEYSNPEFDSLLDQASQLVDVDERRKVMEKIEILLQQDGPFAQPCWRTLMTTYHERVQNFRMHPRYTVFGNEIGVSS